MQNRFQRLIRQPAVLMFSVGVIVLVGSAVLWFTKVHNAPRTVFDAMLTRNLSTSSVVVRQVSREVNGVKIDKRSDVTFGAQNLVRIKTTTTATGSGAAVVTETIAGKDQEYNRYTSIKLGDDSPVIDTSSIINKWAEGSQNSTAYAQTLLRPYGLPMGLVPSGSQERLLAYMRDKGVFQTDYKVAKGSLEGRQTYTYDVSITPEAYVTFLKTYADALRLKDLAAIDPADARQTPPVPVRLTVDVASRRLVAADYPSLGYKETYTDYNVPHQFTPPKPQISAEALEALVSELR